MIESREIMGMPIVVEIRDEVTPEFFEKVFDYFRQVDEQFSPYKDSSEVSRFNRGEINLVDLSEQMKEVFELSEKTKQETKGFFDIKKPDGLIDPSGLVKGWAIYNAAKILTAAGMKNFYIEAGGDIQVAGGDWTVGIRNPFNPGEIVKVLNVADCGVATSGNYFRGDHIYNPHAKSQTIDDIVSLTVIGPNIYEADRFATAAFAMGQAGIVFIEQLPGLEGYMIDKNGIGTQTSGLSKFLISN